jgi:hypothetical protein
MRIKQALPLLLVAVGLAGLTLSAMRPLEPRVEPPIDPRTSDDLRTTVAEVNAALGRLWRGEVFGVPPSTVADLAPVEPAPRADELTILRRLSLALHGTIPSLEEVRRFEADSRPDRLERWTAAMLADTRFADYFAERLARAYVGVEQGQFLIFRRDRFTAWLSRQLRENRPYDALVRDMVAARGVWTGEGEVNFLTGAFANDEFDPDKLAARTARAFLGQRIDCAQCHDHPFDHWKQSEFAGLASHFAHLGLSLAGVVDKPENRNRRMAAAESDARPRPAPAVPFHPEWVPSTGSDREKLAAWLTHPENRRFERAIANRVWGLMFGRPFAARLLVRSSTPPEEEPLWSWTDRAVDDLPDPDDPRFGSQLEVLDILGRDFRAHGYDLRRLIQVIAACDAFRLDSIPPEEEQRSPADMSDAQREAQRLRLQRIEARWAVFPLIRLRPEQVIGSMLQAHHVETIDQNSHLFVRAVRFFRERDFINEFGDPGADELEDRTGTIQQALLRMNGDFAHELSEERPFTAPAQIRAYSPTPEQLLENVFLSCLTRRPTADEQACFLPQLKPAAGRPADGVIQDLYWAVFNAPEFSWNH